MDCWKLGLYGGTKMIGFGENTICGPVGVGVGTGVGVVVGFVVGVGVGVGTPVGFVVGVGVGVGTPVGFTVGVCVGVTIGDEVGVVVGGLVTTAVVVAAGVGVWRGADGVVVLPPQALIAAVKATTDSPAVKLERGMRSFKQYLLEIVQAPQSLSHPRGGTRTAFDRLPCRRAN